MLLAMLAGFLTGNAPSAAETHPPALARPVAAGEALTAGDFSGAAPSIAPLLGKEARRFLPAGAVVRVTDVREPVLVSRNSAVRMQFVKGPLTISADGRALSDGAFGESVRVLSLQSRTTIVGVVAGEGLVLVQ